MNFIRFIGDLRYFWPENIVALIGFPSAWDSLLNTGLGRPAFSTMWIDTYLRFTALFSLLELSWEEIVLFLWFVPAILFGFIGSFLLYRVQFGKAVVPASLTGVIYISNTYFLIILTGGQLGVILAYGFAPIVFFAFLHVIQHVTFKNSLIAGIALGIHTLFDPRLAYITIVAIACYYLMTAFAWKKLVRDMLYVFVSPFLIVVCLHMYWLLPQFLIKTPVGPSELWSVESFRFFSFADFSHAISFLHPNWPDNVFGKVSFLRPEYLVLPLLAFLPLLMVRDKKYQSIIIPFTIIGFIGIFFAKGANDPLGSINEFIFSYVPGMQLFRDSSKWYLLIAFSYSILIPVGLYKLPDLISRLPLKLKQQNIRLVVVVSFLLFWMTLLSQFSIFHEFPIQRTYPPEPYSSLKNFLTKEDRFARTLWVPVRQRFAYFSSNHPAVDFTEIADKNDVKSISLWFRNDSNREFLQNAGVAYVILPEDTEKEIFLLDRKYSHTLYQQYKQVLDSTPWLSHSHKFKNIHLYSLVGQKDRFFYTHSDTDIKWEMISETKYVVHNSSKAVGKLVFSERYSSGWVAAVEGEEIESVPYLNYFNSFLIKNPSSKIVVTYKPQKLVYIGIGISALTVIVAIGIFLRSYKKEKKK